MTVQVSPVEDEIATLGLQQLRHAWRSRFGCEAPAFRSRDLLARAAMVVGGRIELPTLGL